MRLAAEDEKVSVQDEVGRLHSWSHRDFTAQLLAVLEQDPGLRKHLIDAISMSGWLPKSEEADNPDDSGGIMSRLRDEPMLRLSLLARFAEEGWVPENLDYRHDCSQQRTVYPPHGYDVNTIPASMGLALYFRLRDGVTTYSRLLRAHEQHPNIASALDAILEATRP